MEHVDLTQAKEVLQQLSFWGPIVFAVLVTGLVMVLFNGLRRNV